MALVIYSADKPVKNWSANLWLYGVAIYSGGRPLRQYLKKERDWNTFFPYHSRVPLTQIFSADESEIGWLEPDIDVDLLFISSTCAWQQAYIFSA